MRAEVPANLAGERVDRVVALLTGLSRAAVAGLVARGGVRLDGAAVGARSQRVEAGQVLEVDVPEAGAVEPVEPDPGVAVSVVHVDDHVLVVDKAAGVVVHPGAGVRSGTLVHGLLARFPELAGVGDPARPGIVHRLDAGTSGLLVVARTPEAHDALIAALAGRTVERSYRALVRGHPDPPRGVVDAPIGRSPRDRTRMAVAAAGREARTGYEVLERYREPAEVALLACRLETGRTHQIRVHLAAIGHPVVGDDRYGGARGEPRLDRPFLHAARLAFRHPVTGEALAFESPLPDDLAAVLAALA